MMVESMCRVCHWFAISSRLVQACPLCNAGNVVNTLDEVPEND